MNMSGVAVVPEWIYSALDSALVAIGATADVKSRRAAIDRLISAWNMSGRSFHNARYLSSVLEQLDSLDAAATDPEILRVAFAYRGAEHEVGWEDAGMDDSPSSIPQICKADDLLGLGVPRQTVERVKDLAKQLGRHSPKPDDLDAKIIIDADLAILASPPQLYRKLLEGLRGEVPFMDSEDFLRRRRRAIKRLLARQHVFFSPVGRRWDTVARENLEAELNSIEARLSSDDDDSEPLPADEEQSDTVVIRHSLRSPARVVPTEEELAGASESSLESADPGKDGVDREEEGDRPDRPGRQDAVNYEEEDDQQNQPDREDDLASTSTLELLPDIFDSIRHHKD
ncbi:hypothetical protein U6G28_05325 [Actinomycetaceae bacterium MB13-C1-2]|nr:hypothetical protein U6G28_05325 [Actinomycetaceae bacterium MB13-C1-2]